jgi:hypothetical protein
MGFELEVESDGAWVSTLVNELNLHFGVEEKYVYYKRDGSLSDGVEIVSHPSTLAYHKAQPLNKALEGLARLGAKSWRTSTCGLHVHISRRAFTSPSHIWKFTHFIVDNKPSMIKLAGRESRQWASFDDLNEFKGILNRAKGSRHYGRYEALNFGNYETIELRFFRGSLAPRRVYSALELTEGACEYTRNLTSQDVKEGALDFSEFVKWLQRNPEKYPNLLSLINHYDLSYMSRLKTQPVNSGSTSDSEDYF